MTVAVFTEQTGDQQMTTRTNTIHESPWQALMGKIVGDLGTATRSVLPLIGR